MNFWYIFFAVIVLFILAVLFYCLYLELIKGGKEQNGQQKDL